MQTYIQVTSLLNEPELTQEGLEHVNSLAVSRLIANHLDEFKQLHAQEIEKIFTPQVLSRTSVSSPGA